MNTIFSPYVKKIRLKNDFWVLNHSLLMEQVYFKNQALLDDEVFLRALSGKGFLKDDEKDEAIKKDIISKANNDELNLLRVLLTDLCNLKCEYCKVCNNIANPTKEPSPLESVHAAVDALFKKSNKPKTIHITGGEPLIFYGRVKEIINYINQEYSAGEHDFIIIVGTNGVLLDQEKVDFFKKMNVKVIISLDGDEESNRLRVTQDGRSSYDYAISALDKLRQVGIEFGISMVIGGHNIEKTNKNIKLLVERFNPSSIGVNFIKSTKIDDTGKYLITGKEYASHVYDSHKTNRSDGVFLELLARKIFPFVSQKYRLYDCGASNGTTINIDAGGNVGTCKSFLCLKTVYSDKDIEDIINEFKDRSPLFNEYCRACYAQGVCGNGCAYEAKINDENDIIDKRACEYVVEFYDKFIDDLLELNMEKAKKEIQSNGFYIPAKEDREKILGSVRKDLHTLKQCVGHEI